MQVPVRSDLALKVKKEPRMDMRGYKPKPTAYEKKVIIIEWKFLLLMV